MAIQKETLTVATSDLMFMGALPSDDGKKMIYYFQGSDFIPDYNIEISPEQAVENISFQGEVDLLSGAFKPSHKFSIIKEALPKYPALKALQFGKVYNVRYAISPQNTGGDRAFSYAKMNLIKINGVINPPQNGASTSNQQTAVAAAAK